MDWLLLLVLCITSHLRTVSTLILQLLTDILVSTSSPISIPESISSVHSVPAHSGPVLPSPASPNLPSSTILVASIVTTTGEVVVSSSFQSQSMFLVVSQTTITSTEKSVKSTEHPIATMPTTTESVTHTPIKVPTTSIHSTSSTSARTTTAGSSATSASTKVHVPTPDATQSHTSSKPSLDPTRDELTSVPTTKAATSISLKEIKGSTRSTTTSTITDQPESTFSSLVAVTVTNPDNGRAVLSTPPLITILSTSTEPNGDFVTYTHVVANPTGFNGGNQTLKNSGFLSNQGAMAGVFVVVGVLTATVILCTVFLFRRRRRLNYRRRWLAGMNQQTLSMPSNPFEDPRDPPLMRTVERDHDGTNWDRTDAAPFHGVGPSSFHSSSSQQHSGFGLAGIGITADPPRAAAPSNDSADSTHEQRFSLVGLAFTTEDLIHSRASIAQSSPSIYPPSLPPVGDEEDSDVIRWPNGEEAPQTRRNNFPVEAPPRPPRSHLRASISKPTESYPLTPPASVSSHSNSMPPSPIFDQSQVKGFQDVVFGRRTLLDVRPRTSHDTMAESP